MSEATLDVSGAAWSLEQSDGYWRYVNHAEGVATSGFMSREVAEANADMHAARALPAMRKRYGELYGNGEQIT